MKKKSLIFWVLLASFSELIILSSCKKELSCENCKGTNQPPIAEAGIDQIVILPTDSVTLDGNASNDPDGTITVYQWRKISGPASFIIVNPVLALTKVKNLIQGVYNLELKVTDNGGLSAKDTIQITVNAAGIQCSLNRPVINVQLVPFGTLSQPRKLIYAATAGTKILFAGGYSGPNNNTISTRVDIYDFAANTWSIAELSKARHYMTVATIGNKIFFAGGSDDDYNVNRFIDFSRVDIYDAVANTWSTAELSEARDRLTSASLGDKIFFAGGNSRNAINPISNRIDIYNNTTNTWSIDSLSESRMDLSATTAGNKIYFAGGLGMMTPNSSYKIDVYDGATNSWSTSSLGEGKQLFGSIAVANKIYWAGGIISSSSAGGIIKSSQVEIRDINTQVSTFACLSQRKAMFETVLKNNEIVFFIDLVHSPGELFLDFEIYNTATDTWSIGRLNQGISLMSIISVNNKIYVAGGSLSSGIEVLSNQVWLLEW
jgi:N-acetylneuraminic acid mutarotase